MGVFDNKAGSAPDTDNKAASTSTPEPTKTDNAAPAGDKPVTQASTSEEAKAQGQEGSVGPNGETSLPIKSEGTLENGSKPVAQQTTDNEEFPGQDMKNLIDQDIASSATAMSNARSGGEGIATDSVLGAFFKDKDKPSEEDKAKFRRPGKASDSASTDELKPVAAYKHREVNHFKVGPFEFRRHILEIYSDEAHDRFLELYQGLTPRDQNAIVEYDIEAAARVEKPVQVARGSLGTDNIKDPKLVQ